LEANSKVNLETYLAVDLGEYLEVDLSVASEHTEERTVNWAASVPWWEIGSILESMHR
jgi:hypothetical protein